MPARVEEDMNTTSSLCPICGHVPHATLHRAPGHVYFVEDYSDGEIKIGYSANLIQRLRAIELPRKGGFKAVSCLRLIGLIPGTLDSERELHKRFRPSRIPYKEGWYRPTEELWGEITATGRAAIRHIRRQHCRDTALLSPYTLTPKELHALSRTALRYREVLYNSATSEDYPTRFVREAIATTSENAYCLVFSQRLKDQYDRLRDSLARHATARAEEAHDAENVPEVR